MNFLKKAKNAATFQHPFKEENVHFWYEDIYL